MKIVLVYPDFGDRKVFHPPLGLASIATSLEKNKHEVKVIIGCFEKNLNSAFQKIKNYNPEIVAISSLSYTFPKAIKLIKKCKKEKFKTILGGVHPTVFKEDSINYADYVILGEAEETIVELIDAIEKNKSLEKIKGLCYKHNSQIKYNPKRDSLDINKIPIPKRECLPMKFYLKISPSSSFFFSLPKPSTTMSVIRGCPFNCIYCQPTQRILGGLKVRYRSPTLVNDEIEYLIKNFKIKSLLFVDDLFTFSKKWTKEVCEEMIRRKINKKIVWDCNSRVDCISEDLIRLMKKAGCVRIRFGVESGSQKVLDNLRKGTTVKQIIQTFNLTNKYGMLTHAYFMFGNPGENNKTINESFNLLKKIKPDSIQSSILTPLPGTDLYDKNTSKEKIDLHYMNTSESRIKIDVTDKDLNNYIKSFKKLALRIALKKIISNLIKNPKNINLFFNRIFYSLDYNFLRDSIKWVFNKKIY
ncbi:MAG: B12-binding domain-containing radical SAM protein [Nanoarchaeota archaeon]|nr:B12-binding domain-containing radical SAM protein [Nanoarchaeota archaeon]